MNSWPLIASGLLMGAAGSIHCVAMCAALQQTAIAGRRTISIQAAGSRPRHHLWFQGGRVVGYTLLGLAAGTAGDWLLAAASMKPAFQSVWASLNAVLLSIGMSMLLSGREPHWLASLAPRWVRTLPQGPVRPLSLAARGLLWALLPCGLLYAALALAILAGEPIGAALVMTAFGLGSASGLLLFQAGLRGVLSVIAGTLAPGSADTASLRISGLLLSIMAGIALVAAVAGYDNPFCS
jgi:sulfite exporter TauE/SafE